MERVLSMCNHSELGLSLTCWGWKEVWAWAIKVNWGCHLLAEGGKWCEHEQSQWIGIATNSLRVESGVSMSNHSELGLSLTSWARKVVWAWAITVNWIVTYLLSKESGVNMSTHSEWALSLTSWGWKVVWAWAITVNWHCHLHAEGGQWCEHEQSQWIGIVTYSLKVESGVSMSNHSQLGLSLTS